jgi:preprotein translocase subunit Sec61beta
VDPDQKGRAMVVGIGFVVAVLIIVAIVASRRKD